jgi:phage-related baseplate assembly protein
MSEQIDHTRFLELLIARFPTVADNIDDISRGLLHPEMATLARATQAAIQQRDFVTVTEHFAFMDDVLKAASSEVENAVYVSYLENIDLDSTDDRFEQARSILPAALPQALVELEEHLNNIFRNQDRVTD